MPNSRVRGAQDGTKILAGSRSDRRLMLNPTSTSPSTGGRPWKTDLLLVRNNDMTRCDGQLRRR